MIFQIIGVLEMRFITLLMSVQNKTQVATARQLLLFFMLSFGLIACIQAPKFNITASVPSRIEKGGVTVCSLTPCAISGFHHVNGYGMCIGTRDTPLEAFPIIPLSGYKQSKVVNGSCDKNYDVYFDMGSGGIVNTISQDGVTNQTSLAQKLEVLNDLKKRNLITDSEYESKRKQLLNELK